VCPETGNEELFLGEGEQAWLEEKRILLWRPGMPAPSELRPAASSQPPKIDRCPLGVMRSARVLEAGFLRSHGHNAGGIPYHVPITNTPYFLCLDLLSRTGGSKGDGSCLYRPAPNLGSCIPLLRTAQQERADPSLPLAVLTPGQRLRRSSHEHEQTQEKPRESSSPQAFPLSLCIDLDLLKHANVAPYAGGPLSRTCIAHRVLMSHEGRENVPELIKMTGRQTSNSIRLISCRRTAEYEFYRI
jgi:hypothetical protein